MKLVSRSGRILGTFTPSPLGTVKVQKSTGEIVNMPMPRKQRRRLIRLARREKV